MIVAIHPPFRIHNGRSSRRHGQGNTSKSTNNSDSDPSGKGVWEGRGWMGRLGRVTLLERVMRVWISCRKSARSLWIKNDRAPLLRCLPT